MDKQKPQKLADMDFNFNITWRTLKYLIPIFALIVIPVLFRINFGISRAFDLMISAILVTSFYNIPWFRASNMEPQKINKNRQNIFLWIFLIFVLTLFTFVYFYESTFENFLTSTLKINPETAIDSIRSFLGIHLQQ